MKKERRLGSLPFMAEGFTSVSPGILAWAQKEDALGVAK